MFFTNLFLVLILIGLILIINRLEKLCCIINKIKNILIDIRIILARIENDYRL